MNRATRFQKNPGDIIVMVDRVGFEPTTSAVRGRRKYW